MKKAVSLILAFVLIAVLFAGCGGSPSSTVSPGETSARQFTDDVGRTVTVPQKVEKIAVSGPLTQIYILPIASDLMVGYANEFSMDASKYINADFLKLPSLGQLYGGKGTMDLEALLAAAPDVVIDVGEPKGNIVEDLDKLTEQTGIPFVHINATVETSPEAYRKLGDLLSRQDKAEQLATYLEGIYSEVTAIMEKVDADGARKTMLYCLGDKGLNVLAEKSFHAETINEVAKNAAELDDVQSSGDGNEVDMEQLILWNPDVIVFAPESVYSEVGNEVTWQQLDAIKNGSYYETPFGPYGWLQSPPAVQRYLGLMWLCSILYPDYCTYNLSDKVIEYYKLFYDYDLTQAEFAAMTANS